MPPLPEGLAGATVLDRDKHVHRVGDLWATGPLALVFLRHFA